MTDIALLCRIFDPTPTDDLVSKRTQGVDTLLRAWKERTHVKDLLRIAAGVAAGVNDPTALPHELATEAVSHLSKNSPALIFQGHEMEIAVCAAAALLRWIESSTHADGAHPLTVQACMASGLWSAMALQSPSSNPRLEDLRQQLLAASREAVLAHARASRKRIAVPALEIELNDDEAASIPKAVEKLTIVAEKSISALRENAIRDREELDLLWWTVNGYSEILSKPLSQVSETTRAVVASLEVSQLSRRLPTESQKHLAVRNIQPGKAITLKAVLRSLGTDRETIAKSYEQNKLIPEFPTVFPVLSAIASDGHKVDEAKALSLVEWAKHIVLEGCIATMNLQVRPEI